MPRTRCMASLKNSDINSSSSFEVNVLSSSYSSNISLVSPSPSSKRRASSVKKKDQKKPRSSAYGSLSPEDMQRFWEVEQKNMYDSFKSRPIVPGRVINLSQLRNSHYPVSLFLKDQKLSMLFSICGLDFFQEVVRLFYANLCVSNDNGELEALIMGSHIIVNDLLFEDVFGTKFSGVISYMNDIWPNDFEVSLEGAKIVVA
uniref:Uncharacterized protein n=1 Tax=Solanum tuberosum TaxID=4113 RepID=M1DKN7_SOLTU